MPKSEEKDLLILIRSVRKTTLQKFTKQLKLSKEAQKFGLLNAIQKKSFNKNKFICKHQLNTKQYNSIKFKLFKDVINHLKVNYYENSGTVFQNEIKEYELLLKNGLYVKAYRKLKTIKKIALEKCDFSAAYGVQHKAILYNLFNHINNKITSEKALNELNEYNQLAKNLNDYGRLNLEALNLHYKFLDKRSKDRGILLKYLEHDLLRDESKAKSVLAKYRFYLTRSLIYCGVNNYPKCKENALLAYKCISSNPSKHINNYDLNMSSLNNYLDASLNLLETKPFEAIYPKMLKMRSNTNTTEFLGNAIDFQYLCSLHLNYLWIKKDYKNFIECSEAYEEDFIKYEAYLSPNFKLEILLGLARMYFENGNPTKADELCCKIVNQKSNPTSIYLACGNLLHIMINVDAGNYKLIPHLINKSRYFLKNRNRLFDVERLFFNHIKKMKLHFSTFQKKSIYKKLYEELSTEAIQKQETVINNKIRLLPWLKLKIDS